MSEDANVCKKYGEYMQAACYCVDDRLGLKYWACAKYLRTGRFLAAR